MALERSSLNDVSDDGLEFFASDDEEDNPSPSAQRNQCGGKASSIQGLKRKQEEKRKRSHNPSGSFRELRTDPGSAPPQEWRRQREGEGKSTRGALVGANGDQTMQAKQAEGTTSEVREVCERIFEQMKSHLFSRIETSNRAPQQRSSGEGERGDDCAGGNEAAKAASEGLEKDGKRAREYARLLHEGISEERELRLKRVEQLRREQARLPTSVVQEIDRKLLAMECAFSRASEALQRDAQQV